MPLESEEKYNNYHEQIHGWFDFDNIYSDMVKKAPANSHFVEIGSWLGKSSVYMANEIKRSGKKIRFDCVDIWEVTPSLKQYAQTDDLYFAFIENIKNAGVFDLINPVKCDSITASESYKNNSIDFVFIDANHDYDFVKKDILAWLPKVKNGGYIAGHDYNPDWPGVIKAVDEILPGRKINGTSWIMKVQTAFQFLKNEEKYYEAIRLLRTHKDNVYGFIEQVNITAEQQKLYMQTHGSLFHLCLFNEKVVGFIGQIDGDIRVAVDPAFKNMGIGKFMIRKLMKLIPILYAKIKLDNKPSIWMCLSCGFKEYKKDDNFIYMKSTAAL